MQIKSIDFKTFQLNLYLYGYTSICMKYTCICPILYTLFYISLFIVNDEMAKNILFVKNSLQIKSQKERFIVSTMK